MDNRCCGARDPRMFAHVKTLASQKRRMLLTSRQLLQGKALDIENDLRGTLRNFGLKVGMAASDDSRGEGHGLAVSRDFV
jgi:transposase